MVIILFSSSLFTPSFHTIDDIELFPNFFSASSDKFITMSYGAISSGEEATRDVEESDFQEFDMFYVKERKLSKEERCRKLASGVVPLVVAVGILFLFALFVSKAIHPFDKGEYSPPHGGSTGYDVPSLQPPPRGPHVSKPTMSSLASSTASDNSSSKTTEQNSLSPKSENVGTTSDPLSGGGTASCSSHKACKDLGLTLNCCPTSQGKIRIFASNFKSSKILRVHVTSILGVLLGCCK
jgi:hypothetical protein